MRRAAQGLPAGQTLAVATTRRVVQRTMLRTFISLLPSHRRCSTMHSRLLVHPLSHGQSQPNGDGARNKLVRVSQTSPCMVLALLR